MLFSIQEEPIPLPFVALVNLSEFWISKYSEIKKTTIFRLCLNVPMNKNIEKDSKNGVFVATNFKGPSGLL